MNLLLGLLTSGVAGTIVFVILLIIRPISEKLFSKTWHYYSLLIPLVFLLGGGALLTGRLTSQIPYSSTKLNNTAYGISTETMQSQNHFAIPAPSDPASTGQTHTGYVIETIPVPTSHTFIIEPLWGYIIKGIPLILSCWVLGAVLFISLSIKKHLKYRRLVLCQATRYTNIDCKLPIFISATAHTPMLIGIVKPIIVLPHIQFEEEALDMILFHEMVHYKRKDLLYKMIGFIANTVHWYNPAVYAINRQLNILCELSCDEKMAAEMNAKDRKFYGETILQVLHYSIKQKSLANNLMLATNLCNSKKHIKRRLTNMMNAKKTKKHVAILSLAAGILVLGIGFVVSHWIDSAVPIYAASDLPYTAQDLDIQYIPALNETPVSIDEIPTEPQIPYEITPSFEETEYTVTSRTYISFVYDIVEAAFSDNIMITAPDGGIYAEDFDRLREEAQRVLALYDNGAWPSSESARDAAHRLFGIQAHLPGFKEPFQWPLGDTHNNVTSIFGQRINPITNREEFHNGIDIPAPTGTHILAAKDGYVTFAGWNEGFGHTIIIYHGNGYSSLYAHASSIYIEAGQFVYQGKHIANVGSTGLSTGPNLHFEIHINDTAVDPLYYLISR